jgi:ABC-2 type transport system permease protein
MAIFLGLATTAFGLQLVGAWWVTPLLLLCGCLSFMAIGLLAGAVSKTAEAAAGFANFIVLPMAFLSGTFIPLDQAPEWIQQVSKVLPLRYLNEGMLDVMGPWRRRGGGAGADGGDARLRRSHRPRRDPLLSV